jgi:hypothetical protein
MDQVNAMIEAKATKLLTLALLVELQKVAPHTVDLIDSYMVELLSRPSIESSDRDAIAVARDLLSGLR